MLRRCVVIVTLGVGLIQPPLAATEWPEDELRMKERVVALSQGEGSLADFRIELMDGSMVSSRHYDIAKGKVVSHGWDAPGSPAKDSERAVTDEAIRQLLRDLVDQQYWAFEGTRFVPDAESFLFRFYDKDLPYVD